MKKRSTRLFLFILVILVSGVSSSSWAQSFEDIERNDAYVWGRGVGSSLEEADKHALQDLASQVSVSVDNRIETTIENAQNEGEVQTSMSTTGNLRVSSSVSLGNCKRLVKEEGGTFIVLRYVPWEEVEKMYEGRKDKIGDLIRTGERAQERNKIGDALRNLYWALKLTLSIPPENHGHLTSDEGRLLATHLREHIGDILDSITVSVARIEKGEDGNMVELSFLYRGMPMINGDFQYFDVTTGSIRPSRTV